MHDVCHASQNISNNDGYGISSLQADFSHERKKLTLSPKDDVLAKEIQSWNSFADGLRAEDRKLFKKMLSECYQHGKAINTKGELFPTESLLMSLVLSQQQLIEFLLEKLK